MKTTALLFMLLITASAQACFYGETNPDYQKALTKAYASFEDKCNAGCFPSTRECLTDHTSCFEEHLTLLESRYDCSESAALVQIAQNACLRFTAPLSTDR